MPAEPLASARALLRLVHVSVVCSRQRSDTVVWFQTMNEEQSAPQVATERLSHPLEDAMHDGAIGDVLHEIWSTCESASFRSGAATWASDEAKGLSKFL